MKRAVLGAALACLALACERPSVTVGVECTLNSDCGDPLVCRLERCRRQCVDSRDCAAGLLCLHIGDQGGVCQLPEEAVCSLTSDCTDPLVCRFGTCTTECAEDRDCPPGARCMEDADAMANACIESTTELCIYDSDCEDPTEICDDDQRCVRECIVSDRDCTPPFVCIDYRCTLPDGG